MPERKEKGGREKKGRKEGGRKDGGGGRGRKREGERMRMDTSEVRLERKLLESLDGFIPNPVTCAPRHPLPGTLPLSGFGNEDRTRVKI